MKGLSVLKRIFLPHKYKAFALLVAVFVLIVAPACWNMHFVPSGYQGRIINPTGFDKKMIPPGQVNLGSQSCTGNQSHMVLLESTTVVVQEQFRGAEISTDHADHRIVTADGVPANVDFYVRMVLPADQKTIDRIFLEVTPENTNDPLETKITLSNIYGRYVEMDIRNRVRAILSGYKNFQDILINYNEANAQVKAAAIAAFEESHVPLKMEDAQLSQVLPDPQVWDSEVKKKAAEALQSQISDIGQMIASNPGYLKYLQWQALKDIATVGSAKGTNTIIIVADGQPVSIDADAWAAAQNVINQLKATPTAAPGSIDVPSTTQPVTPTPTPKKK